MNESSKNQNMSEWAQSESDNDVALELDSHHADPKEVYHEELMFPLFERGIWWPAPNRSTLLGVGERV